jgi:tyrosine-protein phosphatase SIW14
VGVQRKRSSAVSAILLTFALAFAGATPGYTKERESVSKISIDNFGRINDGYYRGAQPKGHDFADLAAFGIKTVIDFTKDGDAAEPGIVQGLGMKFFRIPMTTREVPTAAQLAQFLSIVNDHANQPVYVHCQGGRHRTGVMTAIYRMTGDKWTPAQAFSEMKRYKFGADFLHPEFKQFVYGFHPDPALAAVTAVAGAAAGK